ncbi:Fe(3+)-siderophore ABC transporter permease [Amycolatopsis ultiminotia]|uniref:Fe(3+)-siderophore ABC transporter permease n=1 Tax=Amycolatopsis ultiminotia TaxID=543629 RepID=A0ABP6YPN7_9PSEU
MSGGTVETVAAREVLPHAHRGAVLSAGLGITLVALVAVCVASIAVGAKDLPLSTVWHALSAYDGSVDHMIVRSYRIPRTLLGVLAGVALGAGGTLIQAMTRNPLADPGVLGVNAGAAFAVTIAVGVFGLTGFSSYVWFAFLGAVVVTVVVYRLGSLGRGGATPIRLTLAGIAVGAVLSGVNRGLPLLNAKAFDTMRAWHAGSLSVQGMDIVLALAPFVLTGLALAVWVARSLNAVALGDDLAAALGVHVARTRALGVVALTLLCGAATAAAGPIGFVGLMVPHVARWIVGPDQRWILVHSLVGAPVLLLASDVVGRIVVRPDEMPAGVVTAFLGAPVLVWLVRREQAAGL